MAVHPTYAQMKKLIEFMEQNPRLARSPSCNVGRLVSKRKWEQLTDFLNSMDGLRKDSKQWVRFWIDKKSGIKRRLDARRKAAECRAKWSLAGESQPLSHLDTRIMMLIGNKKSDSHKKRKATTANRREKSARHQQQHSVAIQTSSMELDVSSQGLRRSHRIRINNQMNLEQLRHMEVEERKVANTAALATSLRKACRSLSKMARAVAMCGQTIAEGFERMQ